MSANFQIKLVIEEIQILFFHTIIKYEGNLFTVRIKLTYGKSNVYIDRVLMIIRSKFFF